MPVSVGGNSFGVHLFLACLALAYYAMWPTPNLLPLHELCYPAAVSRVLFISDVVKLSQ